MTRTDRAAFTLDVLRQHIPAPQTELCYENPYELLVAVVLSAQCTDARVNLVTPQLFEAFPTVEAMAEVDADAIFAHIRSVSYPNNKARHLAGAARRIVDVYGGEVPRDLEALQTLPGVGRKTAQVVASVAFDIAALPVDTHVFRVTNRIGLVRKADTVVKVERQLKALWPSEVWGEAHHLLILHGRYTCTARKPRCEVCPVAPACLYYERLRALPPPRHDLDPKKGRYYAPASDHYFDEPALKTDRYGTPQIADPRTHSMNVYDTRTGLSTRKVPDFRV